ncbi:MAG TPA: flagellar hook-associated protein FlgK [Chthoniobacterales bacterium]|nr:flagellar hook-associated protein FlgK [Chthoniobacterales bacterium]
MSLFGDLSSAAQALSTHSQGVALAGKNLANATNPAYARQRLILGDLGTVQTPLGPQSMGVQALGILQIRDQLLDAQLTREISTTSLWQSQEYNLTKAQVDLGVQIDRAGDSGAIGDSSQTATGIGTALTDFFNSFSELSASPTDAGAKQVLLQQAGTLVDQFNTTDSRLASLQSDITTQIATDVGTVNGILKSIADLNTQIQRLEITAPGAAVDLRDQRQSQLEQLGQYINFTATEVPGTHGQIQITTYDTASNPVVLLDKAAPATITFDGTNFTTGVPPVTLGLQSGSLKGQVDVRDGAIQQLRDDIQTTATQFAQAVNQAYNPTGTTGDFFQIPPANGIIALDPTLNFSTLKTTDSGDAGGNELALAVAQLATKQFSTAGGDLIDGTITGYFAKTVSGFGESLANASDRVESETILQQAIRSQRDSVSAVSQDEELTDLMKYQRAFQASSRVINIVDNLLDVVVNGLIR